jgi:hypothetical protein
MDMKALVAAIAHVNSFWTFSAFALAAGLFALKVLLATKGAVSRRGVPAPQLLESPMVWVAVVLFFLLGVLPVVADTFIRALGLRGVSSSHDATVTVLVEDEKGRALEGATVTVLGGESGATTRAGTLTLKTNAANGQAVRIHAEKTGYTVVDRDCPAGGDPVTLTLASAQIPRPVSTEESSQPSVSTTSIENVKQCKKEILDLRTTAEVKDPGWKSIIQQKGPQLADLLDAIDDRYLDPARIILKHEYRGWAFLMIADTYWEVPEKSAAQAEYAERAIRAFAMALGQMDQVTREYRAGNAAATDVYRWMTGPSQDRNRTHYLKAMALADAARTGAPHRTAASAVRELQTIEPAYLTMFPPESHPALAWAIKKQAGPKPDAR